MKTQVININFLLDVASNAAIKAGKAILNIYMSSCKIKTINAAEFPSTEADKLSHQIIVQSLAETGLPVLSEEGRLIEFKERKDWNLFWLIDPLDGTKEFIKKNGEFTVDIALINHVKPIAGIVYEACRDVLYCGSAETGVYKIDKNKKIRLTPLIKRIRMDEMLQQEDVRVVVSRSHLTSETEKFIDQFKNATIIRKGSSLKFMSLLENEADIYPRFATTMEWDTAAAHALLNAMNRGVYQTDMKTELVYNKCCLSNPSFIAF